jgi:hypothetical protein
VGLGEAEGELGREEESCKASNWFIVVSFGFLYFIFYMYFNVITMSCPF